MLVLKNEMSLNEFTQEFDYQLKDLPYDAIEIIFDSLCEIMAEGDHTVMHVRDYLRFQMRVSSLDEVISDYSIDIDDVEDDADAKIDAVMDYLHYHTYLLGTFEDDGITYFIFDEF